MLEGLSAENAQCQRVIEELSKRLEAAEKEVVRSRDSSSVVVQNLSRQCAAKEMELARFAGAVDDVADKVESLEEMQVSPVCPVPFRVQRSAFI